jgi:hypothetical protein
VRAVYENLAGQGGTCYTAVLAIEFADGSFAPLDLFCRKQRCSSNMPGMEARLLILVYADLVDGSGKLGST